MMTTIIHRGPDGAGTWADAPVGLGHQRLAIIDLVTGEQPLASADGTIQVIFNGEIYNFRALRAELARLGHSFHTTSDTEVLAHAIKQWGEAALARLDGMFAFAAWNTRQQCLLLARDRIGKKPLYYAQLPDGGIIFGSEIKALLAHPAVETTLNDAALPAYLCYGYVPAPATWYRSIQQVLPGHALVWENNIIRTWGWWNVQHIAGQERRELDAASAISDVRRLMRAAVERRLISDVPLGAFLSGGIDSSIVVAEMHQCLGQTLETFSIGFAGDAWYDETQYARQVARHLGTKHHEFIVQPDTFDAVETLVRQYDEPFADSSALPTYLLSHMTRQHVTVALSGDGGDEVFAGYERFGAGLWMHHYGRLPHMVRQGIQASLNCIHPKSARNPLARLQRVMNKVALPLAEGFPRWLMLWTPDEIAVLLGQDTQITPHPTTQFRTATAGIHNGLAALLTYNLRTYLPNDLLVKTDRMSMAHGLEVRSPFLDTALIEWALTLPTRLHWRGKRGKWLLRQAYRDVLPATILNRPKHGFGVPLDSWFRQDLRPMLGDLLLSPRAKLNRWIDPHHVRSLCLAHWRGEKNAGHQLWTLLTLETWLQQANRSAIQR